MHNEEFDTDIQADEFPDPIDLNEFEEPISWEEIQDDNPIDEDFEPHDGFDADWELEEAQFSTEYDEENW